MPETESALIKESWLGAHMNVSNFLLLPHSRRLRILHVKVITPIQLYFANEVTHEKLIFGRQLVILDAAIGFQAFCLVQSVPWAPRCALRSKPNVLGFPKKNLPEQLDLSLFCTQVPIFTSKSLCNPSPLIDFLS